MTAPLLFKYLIFPKKVELMNIQWYPGHMTKTRRQMENDVKLVDLVAEVVDARIPISSRNPDIDAMVGERPRLVIFNRTDQADPPPFPPAKPRTLARGWRSGPGCFFTADGCGGPPP